MGTEKNKKNVTDRSTSNSKANDKPWTKKVKVETLEMMSAFETYYAMGAERSINRLAKELGYAPTTIKRWSMSFDWANRVIERDKANIQKLQKRTDEAIVNTKLTYRTTIAKLTERFIRDVEEGKIRCKGIKDFEMIARLDLDLMGADAEQDLVDNMASLVEALGKSGFADVPDPDKDK